MNMPVDGNRLAQQPENRFQLIIARFRCRSSPRTLGTGVYQGHLTLNLNAGQPPQPPDPLLSKHGTCNRCHLTDHRPKRGRRRRQARKFLKRLGPEKHFIRVAHHTLPAEITDAIDNLYGTRTGVCKITAMEKQVRRSLLQIRHNSLNAVRFPWMSDRIAVRIKEL